MDKINMWSAPPGGVAFPSQRNLASAKPRLLIAALVLSFLVFSPRSVRAQNALEATQIQVGAPAQAYLAAPLTVQAVLADSQGRPISKAVVYFLAPAAFLGESGDVVLAQAVTNADGQAVAQIVDDFSGDMTLRAEFRGDAKYAASNVTVQISTAGVGQVYSEHIGVDLPGFNVPPVSSPMAALGSSPLSLARFVQSLWPAMNGWPVAAILLLVWSIYLFAVTFVFRMSALGNAADDSGSPDPGRLL